MAAKFVISSDWHLASLTWKHRPTLLGDASYSLHQIVNFCIENECPLIGAGDLLDSDKPDPGAVAALCHQMERMERADLEVYYIQGQHELATPPWLSVHPWPKHVDRQTFVIGGMKLYGLDWTPRDSVAEALARIPQGTDALVGHQVWAEHMGSLTNPECSVHAMPHVQYIFTGDYHKHQAKTHETSQGSVTMVSPGAISVRNLGELDAKGFWFFNNGMLTSVPLATRPVFAGEIATDDSLMHWGYALNQHLAELNSLPEYRNMPGGIKTPICKITYPEAFVDGHRKITEALGWTHLWLEMISEAKPEVVRDDLGDVPETLDEDGNSTLAGCLDKLLAKESPLRDDILYLLDSPRSPTVCLEEIVTRWNTELQCKSSGSV